MKAFKLFDELRDSFMKTNPDDSTIELYNLLRVTFIDTEILQENQFSQIRKNLRGPGLALELMFFDSKYIYDIVATSNGIDVWTIATQKVTKIALSGKGEYVKLDIYINRTDVSDSDLSYLVERKKYEELRNLRHKLLNIIQ